MNVVNLIDNLLRLLRLTGLDERFIGPLNLCNPVEISACKLARLAVDLTGSRSTIISARCCRTTPPARPNREARFRLDAERGADRLDATRYRQLRRCAAHWRGIDPTLNAPPP